MTHSLSNRTTTNEAERDELLDSELDTVTGGFSLTGFVYSLGDIAVHAARAVAKVVPSLG